MRILSVAPIIVMPAHLISTAEESLHGDLNISIGKSYHSPRLYGCKLKQIRKAVPLIFKTVSLTRRQFVTYSHVQTFQITEQC